MTDADLSLRDNPFDVELSPSLNRTLSDECSRQLDTQMVFGGQSGSADYSQG
jgi:hypothetical protein